MPQTSTGYTGKRPRDCSTNIGVGKLPIVVGHHAAISTPQPQPPAFYKDKLGVVHELSHVTVEVTAVKAAA